MKNLPRDPVVIHSLHPFEVKFLKERLADLCAFCETSPPLKSIEARRVVYQAETEHGLETITIRLGQDGPNKLLPGMMLIHRRGDKIALKVSDPTRFTDPETSLKKLESIHHYQPIFEGWRNLLEHANACDLDNDDVMNLIEQYLAAVACQTGFPVPLNVSIALPTAEAGAKAYITPMGLGKWEQTAIDIYDLEREIESFFTSKFPKAWIFFFGKEQNGYLRFAPVHAERHRIQAANIVEAMKTMNDPAFAGLSFHQ